MAAYPHVRRAIPPSATVDDWPATDGWPLRQFDWPGQDTRGSILWSGGRGDHFEKYLEAFAHWHERGWHVTSVDWRGQGGSGRLLPDAMSGHIDDFATWTGDLAEFWRDWTARTPAPHILMGHSMGGHLVLRALVDRVVAPDAAVLVAPMLGFDAGPLPQGIAGLAARALGRIVPRRRAWKANERPGVAAAQRATLLTHDPERYADEAWWRQAKPDLAIGPPSWAWMAAAYRSAAVIDAAGAVERVTTPVLIVATDGDALVSPGAIRRIAARLPRHELLMFDADVAHEVLREVDAVRDAALNRIAAFLDVHAPVA